MDILLIVGMDPIDLFGLLYLFLSLTLHLRHTPRQQDRFLRPQD